MPPGSERRRGAALVAVVGGMAVLALAAPERFPAVDGMLDVAVEADGPGPVRLVARAAWAPLSEVSPERAGCRLVALVQLPGGELPAAVEVAPGSATTGWTPDAQRVREQYAEVLPPPLLRQLAARPVAVLVDDPGAGTMSLTWTFVPGTVAQASAADVRLFLAPVCDDAVHGLVELGRPR